MTSNDKLDDMIRKAYGKTAYNQGSATVSCPNDEELAYYITCLLREEGVDKVVKDHVTECDSCFTKVASAIAALSTFDKGQQPTAGSNAIKQAQSIPRRYPCVRKKARFRRSISLWIAAFFFALSFLVKAYFMQFLVAAGIFGLKWVMDTGGSKALIMVYDTWHKQRITRADDEKKDTYIRPPRI